MNPINKDELRVHILDTIHAYQSVKRRCHAIREAQIEALSAYCSRDKCRSDSLVRTYVTALITQIKREVDQRWSLFFKKRPSTLVSMLEQTISNYDRQPISVPVVPMHCPQVPEFMPLARPYVQSQAALTLD